MRYINLRYLLIYLQRSPYPIAVLRGALPTSKGG